MIDDDIEDLKLMQYKLLQQMILQLTDEDLKELGRMILLEVKRRKG